MNFNFDPEEYKKVSRAIEEKVKKISDAESISFGIILITTSLLIFLVSCTRIGRDDIYGFQLITKYRVVTAQLFVLFHVLTIIVLAPRKFPDRFQFATLFSLVNVALFFSIYTVEARNKISNFPDTGNISVACFFILAITILLFGIKAHYRESQLWVFKQLGRLYWPLERRYESENQEKYIQKNKIREMMWGGIALLLSGILILGFQIWDIFMQGYTSHDTVLNLMFSIILIMGGIALIVLYNFRK